MAHKQAKSPLPKRHVAVVPRRAVSNERLADHRPLPPHSPRSADTLEDFGYRFQDGKLLSIHDRRPFEYKVYSDPKANQQRYHQIGKLVEKYVYELLVHRCQLFTRSIPIDPRAGEPTGFIFASDNIHTAPYLMIIIHGTGSVRAGQWSRKLIINNGLSEGSQIDYILEARRRGFGVIVTNTNMRTDESSDHSTGLIRGSSSPQEHGCYVWEHYVRPNRRADICIVAHSYGGAVVVAMAEQFTQDFQKRVFAIALTDSPMKAYVKSCSPAVLKILQQKTINWVANSKAADTDLKILRDYGRLRSSGHLLHEWTSYTAFRGVFKYIETERLKWEQEKR